MPCSPFSIETPQGRVTGIICTRRRKVPCAFCQAPHTHLCDYPMANGKTCDRKLCPQHRTRVSRDRDYCPEHMGAIKT